MGGGAATQPRDFCLQSPTAAVCSTEKAIWTWATEHPARRNSRPTHSNKLVVLLSGERQELLDSGSINLEKFQSPIRRMIPADERGRTLSQSAVPVALLISGALIRRPPVSSHR